MKEYFKTLLIAGVPFGIIMSIFTVLMSGTYYGVILGMGTGLVFGIILSTFTQIQTIRFKKLSPEIANGSPVIKDGGANHFVGKEAVGGWLILTPKEVIFKSHSFNVKDHKLTIPLNRISDITPVLTLGHVPNGILITTNDGCSERFVVHSRQVWIKNINKAVYEMESNVN